MQNKVLRNNKSKDVKEGRRMSCGGSEDVS